MTDRPLSLTALGCAFTLALGAVATAAAQGASPPLRLVSSRVSLAGTSNVHPYTASSTAARLLRLQVAGGVLAPDVWSRILEPGALDAFEIAIPAASLTSPKEGLDKNMHKALKVAQHPDITFRLTRVEGADAGGRRAVGILQVAGVERLVTLPLKTRQTTDGFAISGELPLLMTDFGITPPKAMLGMLKTDPKVTIAFEVVFGIPLT